MVAAQGGPADFVENWQRYLPVAPVQRDVFPDLAGPVAAIDTRAVGLAVVALGGGRRREGDRIDSRVGFVGLAGVADVVGPDAPLGRVHAADDEGARTAAAALRAAYRIGPGGSRRPLVHERIG
jgi:thymidine phosphorylase